MNGGGWNYTVQGYSPHKCGQKSCCSAFNAVVAAFLLDISIFLSSSYMPEVHLDIPGRSPKSPTHLLDWYSSYPRRITSSDCIPPPFLYVILHFGASSIIHSSSNVSTSSNRGQGPVYKFGPLSAQKSLRICMRVFWYTKYWNLNRESYY